MIDILFGSEHEKQLLCILQMAGKMIGVAEFCLGILPAANRGDYSNGSYLFRYSVSIVLPNFGLNDEA